MRQSNVKYQFPCLQYIYDRCQTTEEPLNNFLSFAIENFLLNLFVCIVFRKISNSLLYFRITLKIVSSNHLPKKKIFTF